jgi:hypothetical protein
MSGAGNGQDFFLAGVANLPVRSREIEKTLKAMMETFC